MNAKKLKELLVSLDPNFSAVIEERPDGSTWLIGPYPSFIIMFDVPGADGQEKADGYIVSVNSDAPNVAYFLQQVFKVMPEIIHFGPYCEDEENMSIVGGPDAYQMKEEILLKTAALIYARRKAEKEDTPKIIVPEQKIVIAGK